MPDEPLGRRERAKRDKRARILAAASDLFERDGYATVTTQEIADAADVGAGTLFRYFPTKADLLVEVFDEWLRVGMEERGGPASRRNDPVEAILELAEPLVRASVEHPESTAVYFRETQFAAPGMRESAVRRVQSLPGVVQRILETHTTGDSVRPGVDLRDVAEAIYASVYIEIVRVATGRRDAADLRARLRHVVTFLIGSLEVDETSGRRSAA